ncbi:hypothetical protein ACFWOJ_37310 [Streptomyces sp. NPDC058439]|uniref:hypothetical protein n=1 Tax=Streptomyces sp. NPDC058439 TaxID=3346500 RepID=UPI00366151A7
MTAEAPPMTPDQMLRAIDYVEAVWGFDVDAMDQLEQHGTPPIRHLLADFLHLLVLSANSSVAAEDAPPDDHTVAITNALVRAVRQWAETAQPDTPEGDDDASDGIVIPDYREASTAIARTIAQYVLDAYVGEPGDLSARLAPFRAAWSVAR